MASKYLVNVKEQNPVRQRKMEDRLMPVRKQQESETVMQKIERAPGTEEEIRRIFRSGGGAVKNKTNQTR